MDTPSMLSNRTRLSVRRARFIQYSVRRFGANSVLSGMELHVCSSRLLTIPLTVPLEACGIKAWPDCFSQHRLRSAESVMNVKA
eukprot:2070889-Prymnesium_polylepis.2